MKRYIYYSVLFHVVVTMFAYLGLPSFREIGPVDVPVSVEILTVAETTNVPVVQKRPVKAEKKPAPPPQPPQQASNQLPAPPEPTPPEPEQVAIAPEAEPRPKPKAKQKPRPDDDKKPSPAQPKPKKKPAPPDPFASVLKTLEELSAAPPDETAEKKEKEKPAPTFEEQMANALETPTPRRDTGPSLTISEIDLVRQQIAQCWNMPSGAKDAHEMIVELKLLMNSDGTVMQATIENQAQMAADPFYMAMAESTLRAVLNPACSPLRLPPEKYENWKEMRLTFNPREMFGL